MARTTAALPQGTRITDYVSLGVITRTVPPAKVHGALAATGRASIRQRDLPAHVVVYYVIALALYMHSSYREVLRCLLEGLQWLEDPSQALKVAGRSGISQARTRLGSEPLRQMHDEIVRPIATQETKGAWYRAWRLVSLDGSTMDVADELANDEAFGRPGASRGASAYPQVRFVFLVENGTHVLFGTRVSGCRVGEVTLARSVLPALQKGMLCLADRRFFGFELCALARSAGADLLWRLKKNRAMPVSATLSARRWRALRHRRPPAASKARRSLARNSEREELLAAPCSMKSPRRAPSPGNAQPAPARSRGSAAGRAAARVRRSAQSAALRPASGAPPVEVVRAGDPVRRRRGDGGRSPCPIISVVPAPGEG